MAQFEYKESSKKYEDGVKFAVVLSAEVSSKCVNWVDKKLHTYIHIHTHTHRQQRIDVNLYQE
jgi:hypothetical protein